MQPREFVEKAFSAYYQASARLIEPPPAIAKREFGFLLFAGRGMVRHKSFSSVQDIGFFLENNSASDVYYSSAYYDDPEAEMDKKNWLGADLIFDIDADHIPTKCDKVHDKWTCDSCGFVGKGLTPERCPNCSGQKFDVKTWPCETCLESAKTELCKLSEMLIGDFGLDEREIRAFFSGHRGYHVHVENEAVISLDADARKEIVDYVCGMGLNVGTQAIENTGHKLRMSEGAPRLDDSAWKGRIARGVYDFISSAKQENYKNLGLSKNVIEAIMKNKDALLRSWRTAEPIWSVKGVGPETWDRIFRFCAETLSANVDTVVTTDIHRLIRVANTLHGKTGLKKLEFSISNTESFDAFKVAVAFKKGSATVFVYDSPAFRLGDETFGPYKDERVELPTAAAVLLVCKERAEVVE